MANKTYFIVLIGGPGVVVPCDSHHDQTWTNYVVPIQVATSNREVKLDEGEAMQWWVYGPAYRARWEDDVKGRTTVQQSEVKRVKGQHAAD